jgi:parallel beta-helix repeat protein
MRYIFFTQAPKIPLLLLLMSIFFHPHIGMCSTYYFSSSSGNDTYSGTSSQAPWKSLGRIETTTLLPGDSILLKKGDSWKETISLSSSGTEEKVIRISAYGDGNRPVLKGAETITGWSRTADGVFVYKYRGICSGLLEDRKPLRRASSVSLSDGQWFFDGDYIFYRPANGTTDNHLLERCSRGALLTVKGKGNIIIDGIEFYGANKFGIRLIDCYAITIRDCTVISNGLEGIAIQREHAESLCERIRIQGNTIEWNANGIYISGKGGGFKSSGYKECEITENTITHTNYENAWGHTTKDGHAIGIQNSSSCRIEGNRITDNYSGIALWTAESYESRNNIFTRNFVARSHLYGIAHGSDGKNNSYNNTWSFNIIVDNGNCPGNWGGLRINRCQEKGNYYYNNTLYNNDINIYLFSFPDYHVIKNNISLNPRKFHIWLDRSAGRNNVIDTNCYYSEKNNLFYARSTESTAFNEWKKRSGQDAHSFFLNPLLKSEKPNSDDEFCLKDSSPCRGRAAEEGLDLHKDYFGNRSRDLGACGFVDKP